MRFSVTSACEGKQDDCGGGEAADPRIMDYGSRPFRLGFDRAAADAPAVLPGPTAQSARVGVVLLPECPYRSQMLSRRALALAGVVATITLATWGIFGGAGVEALNCLAGIGSFALMLHTLNNIEDNSSPPNGRVTSVEVQPPEILGDAAPTDEPATDPLSRPMTCNSPTTKPGTQTRQRPPLEPDSGAGDLHELHEPGDRGRTAQWMLSHPVYTRFVLAVVAMLLVALLTLIGQWADGTTANNYECVMGICYTTSST
jgi:hypothetical protein